MRPKHYHMCDLSVWCDGETTASAVAAHKKVNGASAAGIYAGVQCASVV